MHHHPSLTPFRKRSDIVIPTSVRRFKWYRTDINMTNLMSTLTSDINWILNIVKPVYSGGDGFTKRRKIRSFWWKCPYKSCLFYLWTPATCLERPPWRGTLCKVEPMLENIESISLWHACMRYRTDTKLWHHLDIRCIISDFCAM